MLAEAESLARVGARELVLVAQDTTAFGKDLGLRDGLAALLRQLAAVDGIGWVRFLYAYPTTLGDGVLAAMAEVPGVCRYVDIPLQHANRRVLRDMRAPGNRQSNEALVARIREAVPGVAIRSTFIVGFPGETEDEYRELHDFVAEARFDAMGAFVYSNEESAASFVTEEVVSEAEKEVRRARLMELQRGIALDRHRAMVGKVVTVLTDGPAEESDLLLGGRTEGQAPRCGCPGPDRGRRGAGRPLRGCADHRGASGRPHCGGGRPGRATFRNPRNPGLETAPPPARRIFPANARRPGGCYTRPFGCGPSGKGFAPVFSVARRDWCGGLSPIPLTDEAPKHFATRT